MPTRQSIKQSLTIMNKGATGFNPTAAEMAAVFDGIKAEIEALGGNEE